jgi:uncharacterized integral membrane protein
MFYDVNNNNLWHSLIHSFFHLILTIFIFINVKSITFARWDVGCLSFEDHQILCENQA